MAPRHRFMTSVSGAMTMTLDREQMIREIYAGVGVVSTGPSSPSSPASNPAIAPWPYDLDQARVLLKEAGWEDLNNDGVLEYQLDDEYFSKGTPFKFEFTITQSGETTERIISYLVSQCEEVGIICEPRVVDWSFYSDMLKGRDFDAMIMGWSASGPESDPRQIWHRDSIQNQGDNFIQWDNQAASDLIDKGRSTMDAESRMLIWHDFHDILHDEQPYTFVRVAPWIGSSIVRSAMSRHTPWVWSPPNSSESEKATPLPRADEASASVHGNA